MNENSELKSAGSEKVARLNPWFGIWFHTRNTLAYTWRVIPEEYIHRIFMATGMLFMFAIRLPDWFAIAPNPIGVMIQILLVGPVGGIMAGYLYSACLRIVGKWFGKDIPSVFAKCTVAWSQLPFAAFWGCFVVTYWLLNRHQSILHEKQIWLFADFFGWLPLLVATPLLFWGIVIRIRSIAAMYGTTLGRAIAIWLLTILLAYVPAVGMIVTYSAIYYVTASVPN